MSMIYASLSVSAKRSQAYGLADHVGRALLAFTAGRHRYFTFPAKMSVNLFIWSSMALGKLKDGVRKLTDSLIINS